MARFELNSVAELESVANEFVSEFGSPGTFLFRGEMGAGKTTFITALCKALRIEDYVSSPTFSLVNEYNGNGVKVFHFDCYRLNSPEEALDFGIEEYFDSGHWCFVEWPEMIEDYLPADAVVVKIEIHGQKRVISWGTEA